MAQEEHTENQGPGHGRMNPLAMASSLLWFRAKMKAGDEEDPDAPGIVMGGERSNRILRRASDLAGEGREDDDAVAELRALAGRHRRSLGTALQLSRFGGAHLEQRRANHAHRLLTAAVTGTSVEPVTPAELERFAALAHVFDALRRDESILAELLAREPGLAQVAEDAQAGRYGLRRDAAARRSQGEDPERRRTNVENEQLRRELTDRVKQLVGPHSPNADPVIRSRVARDMALAGVERLRPPG